MKRETFEKRLAKIYAEDDDFVFYGCESAIGSLNQIQQAVLDADNYSDYREKDIEFDDEQKAELKKIAKENNLKSYQDWANYEIELSGRGGWYKNTNEFAKMLLDNDYFCDLTNLELVESFCEFTKTFMCDTYKAKFANSLK